MNRPILAVVLSALVATAACGGDSENGADEGTQGPATSIGPSATDSAAAPAATTASAAAGAPVTAPAGTAFLDPNSATREQLTAVPGITPEMADAVIAGRPYADMRGVNAKLTGLTDEQRDSVYTRLWKPLDLNSATAEEIELIPGIGARMRHEFEEYRPYRGIEQFRREIGKYVEPAEVARLERYVTIAS